MGLTDDQRKELKRLQDLEKQPDPPSVGRSVRFDVNLGDKEQVSLAQRLGLIPKDDDGDGGDDDQEADQPPRRRAKFADRLMEG